MPVLSVDGGIGRPEFAGPASALEVFAGNEGRAGALTPLTPLCPLHR